MLNPCACNLNERPLRLSKEMEADASPRKYIILADICMSPFQSREYILLYIIFSLDYKSFLQAPPCISPPLHNFVGITFTYYQWK